MSDRCDVAGCEEAPALYGPSGRRCMAHVPREAPLRSDVPAAADEALYAEGRFWSSPRRRGGEICFRGSRLPVASVQSYKGRGYTPAEVVREWADLLTEDLVLAAWAFPDQHVLTLEDDADGRVRRLRARLALLEIARAEAVRAGKRLAEGRATDAELRDRVTTICDEALGLQPVQSAEDSLTMIEQHLHELRREPDEAQALIARDGWINVENQHGLLGGVRYLLHHAAALREDRDAAQNELRAYESDQDAAVQHVLDERDAARAMFDAARARLAEVERVLTRWPWDGAAALRVLRGEPLVRERT